MLIVCLLWCTAGNSFAESGYGKLVPNPRGLPMYDGFTRPESKSTYTVDYTRFWETNGLGDFTNPDARNSVSREFAKDELVGEGTSVIRRISGARIVGGYWVAEDRICVALPPGAIIEPEVYEPMIPELWSNTSAYTDTSSWTKGAPALSYVARIFDKSLLGMHVDCLLEDGTVLPLILTDIKALHKGYYNGELCRDTEFDGYAQWRGDSSGSLAYAGIIEVCTSGSYDDFNKNKLSDLKLENNRIVCFRCYSETRGRFQ